MLSEVLEHVSPWLDQLPAVALLVLGIRHELTRLTSAVESTAAAVKRVAEVVELHEQRLDRLEGGERS